MAKDDKAKVRMTVIHFETESSNETLQENIRNLANTISRSLVQPVKLVTLPPTGSDSLNQLEATTMADSEEEIELEEQLPAPSKKASRPKKRATPSKILEDLDLESGDVPLKDFYESKQPSSNHLRYLVIAAWLKEYRGIDEVTKDHIYTCYRWLNMGTLADITQPLRTMKKQGWFGKGNEPGAYAINRIGLNQVRDLDEG